jgi:hypothetical protein
MGLLVQDGYFRPERQLVRPSEVNFQTIGLLHALSTICLCSELETMRVTSPRGALGTSLLFPLTLPLFCACASPRAAAPKAPSLPSMPRMEVMPAVPELPRSLESGPYELPEALDSKLQAVEEVYEDKYWVHSAPDSFHLPKGELVVVALPE